MLPLASGEFRKPWPREPSWVFSVAETIWGRLQRERHRNGQTFAGLDLLAALDIGRQWRSVEEYVNVMDFPVQHRHQWGGYSEALLLSHEWKIVVANFGHAASGQYFLLCEPIRPPGAEDRDRVCLLWKRTHYDLLVILDGLWSRAERRN